ncbi:MAG: hypothetical protein SOX04_00670 [Eubacteriales bacterium]|nr:hypothetical protein [Christensenellaceae bacterium]MCI7583862.1 hypothetical protein [Christensenellaceae bacterium]MCI7769920.1 hypothetical protein [Christensenellaceae bacterium]MDD7093038.1 hypothetical protein [Christensenellaceae bacterium]MDY3241052.1 hypothetical protein [Eubacteriales bacterium]
MKFDSILEYQKIDSELVKIEKELSHSDEKEKASALNAKLKTAGDNMAQLNMEADELGRNAEKLASSVGDYENEINEIAAHIGEVGDMQEIEYYEKILAGLTEDVQKLMREIQKISARMDSVKEGSDGLTRQAVQINEQYKVALQNYQALKQKLQNAGRPIMEKLKNIEKDIPAPVLAAYKRLRTQRKLPAFVEYKGDGSCFCGMNLPNDCIGKLKTDGDFVECPNCGRIVILNK